jgi:hypothetical protein
MVNKLPSGVIGPAQAMIMPESRRILQPRHQVVPRMIDAYRQAIVVGETTRWLA